MADGGAVRSDQRAGAAVRSMSRRDRWQRRVDRLIRDNRFTIAVVFPLVGAVLLVASAESLVGPPWRFNPWLLLFGTLVMRSPVIAAVAPAVDRRGLGVLAGLVGFTFAVELVAVRTGWPYGAFTYGTDLGPMLVDAVPLALPLFYLPLVVDAYVVTVVLGASRVEHRPTRVVSVLGTVLLLDAVLDPGAVAIGFWRYADGGVFYGVPWTNFVGWLGSGCVAVLGIEWLLDRDRLRDRLDTCDFALDDLVSFALLWGGITALYGRWISAAIAALLLAAIAWTGTRTLPRPPWL
jgi:putative membrane protein